jgi:hypothetical protein
MITATVKASVEQHREQLLELQAATAAYMELLREVTPTLEAVPDDGRSDFTLDGLAGELRQAIDGPPNSDGTPAVIAWWLDALLKAD